MEATEIDETKNAELFGETTSEPALKPVKKKKKKSKKKRKKKRKDLEIEEGLSVIEELEHVGEEYEELETYPIKEPYSYVKILFNKRDFTRFYQAVEPRLSKTEREHLEKIEEVLIKAVSVRIEDLDIEPEKYLNDAVDQVIKSYLSKIGRKEKEKIMYFINRNLLGYGFIDVLMNDPNIEDISCDGPNTPVYIYHRRFESMETNIVATDESKLESYIIRLAQRCGKHISVAEPLLDATLMDGSRVVMTLGKEVSTKGSTFTIRKFREDPFTPPDLVEFRTLNSMMMAYIWLSVQYGMNVLFVGGTASGKTTTLNATSLFIPWQMKIVSIEETRELNLPHPNWIPGCTREGFGGEAIAGKVTGEVNMFDLLKAALRERPEYIVVGEIRGAEAYVLFQAMATGHTTYSTVHAESVPALVNRLENKPIDIPRVMLPSLDACVIQIQTRIGGKRVRRVRQIVEIIGIDPHTGELLTNEAFHWIPGKDEFEFSSKSYLLEKIMVKANMNKTQIMEELKRRQQIIEWMLRTGQRDYNAVANIVSEYYVHPEDVIEEVYADLEKQTARVLTKKKVKRVVKKIKKAPIYEIDEKARKRIEAAKKRLNDAIKRDNRQLEKLENKGNQKNIERFEKNMKRKKRIAEIKIQKMEAQAIKVAKRKKEIKEAKERKVLERQRKIEYKKKKATLNKTKPTSKKVKAKKVKEVAK